jgi:hypothetical protein
MLPESARFCEHYLARAAGVSVRRQTQGGAGGGCFRDFVTSVKTSVPSVVK